MGDKHLPLVPLNLDELRNKAWGWDVLVEGLADLLGDDPYDAPGCAVAAVRKCLEPLQPSTVYEVFAELDQTEGRGGQRSIGSREQARAELGVGNVEINAAIITAAHRFVVTVCHPDRGTDGDPERMRRANLARDMLLEGLVDEGND